MEKATVPSGGVKENKQPSMLHVKHSDLPDIENAGPGDEVEFHGKGHVVSNRGKDEYGDGEATLHLHSLEHKGTKKKGREPEKGQKNAAKMPMNSLKEMIKSKSEE